MKKLFLLAVAFLLCSLSFAQETVYFFDGFDDGTYDRWTRDRQTNWIMEPTNYVGTSAPEAVFAYLNAPDAPQETKVTFSGTARLISSWYSTKGDTNLYVAMNYLFIASEQSKATDKGLGLAVRTSKTEEWVSVFEQTNMKNMANPASVLTKLSKEFQDKDSVQVCIFVTSKTPATTPVYMMYFDDVQFFSVKNTGAEIQLNVPDVMMPATNTIVVQGKMINKGLTMDSCIINYQIDNGQVYSKTYKNLNLSVTKSKDFNFPSTEWDNTTGEHALKVWISNINGAAPGFMVGGDTLIQSLYVPAEGVGVPNRFLLESFTASTCPPCAGFNSGTLTPLLNEYGGKFTMVKYQMNWPGSGDPYYIADAGYRRDYYGINSVPSIFGNGAPVNIGGSTYSVLVKAIENAPNTKALFEIKNIEAVISDTGFLTLKYTILPFATTKANVQSIIMENTTQGNRGTNGETSFKNVTMKMFPNAKGKDVQFVVNVPQDFEYSVDMKTTHMEEIFDLTAAIFVQDKGTKKVYQAADASVGRADKGVDATAVKFRNLPYSANLTLPVLGTLKNLGDKMTSVEVNFQADAENVITTTIDNLDVAWYANYDFELPNWTGTAGQHTWKFWVTKVNDEVLANVTDTAKLTIDLVVSDVVFRPVIEEFTSSTCIPCRPLNEQVINPIYAELKNQISLVKYPMNTPGTGDPYYSSEYLKRANIYGASLESVILDGTPFTWTDTSSTARLTQLKTILQSEINQKSLFDISSPAITIGALGSPNVEIEYTLIPKVSGEFLITNVLVEGQTVKNNRTNGEVAFVNTAMKIIPNATGSKVTLIKDKPYTYRNSTAYKSLKIEEYSDLLLISIIQDPATLQVMQSAENAVVNRTANELTNSVNQIRLYPNPAVNTTEIQLSEKSNIAVYDMTGRIIFEKQNAEGVYSMDISSFSRGSYIVKVSTSTSVSTVKLNVIK